MNNFTFGKLALVAALALSASPVQLEAQSGKSNWSPAGPVLTAGRSRNIIADRSNPNLLYAGSASSGLFKSENGGALWAPVNDQDSIRNISYVAQSISGEIYAGTGEGFLSYPQKLTTQIGVGLYRLDGTSLKLVASAAAVGTVINRVACSPVNANVIALATNKGILISNDKGASFSNASGVATATDIVGMDVKFDGNGVLYCTAGDQRGHVPFDIVKSRIYRSADANLSAFNDITPAALTFTPYGGRIELAIAPSDNNVIYASVANKNTSPPAAVFGNGSSTLKGLYVSYNGGTSWGLILQGSQQLDPLSDGFGGAYGHYAHAIAVHPTNKDIVFVAGWMPFKFVRDRNRGSDSNPIGDWEPLGQPFTLFLPSFLRSVIHDIEIVSGSPTRYYYVTDGGIFRSVDENDSFQPFFKGMITSQFNSVSIDAWPMPIGGVTPGQPVVPARGFIGGTSGSGLVYFAGTADAVAGELVQTGDVYNAEYSKNLPEAAVYATGDGRLIRNSSVLSGAPQPMLMATYKEPIGQLVLTESPFTSNAASPNIPFSLWENWGQLKNTPDKLTFYNDTVRGEAAILGPDPDATALNMLNTKSFTISIPRPVKAAKIDSIVIRTSTVQVLTGGGTAIYSPPYTDRKTVKVKLKDGAPTQTFTNVLSTSTGTISESRTVTVFQGTTFVVATGNTGSVSPRVEYLIRKIPVDPITIDKLEVSFDEAPFKAQPTGTTTSGTDHGGFYKVFATVYYKYNAGDTIFFPDNSITNRSYTLTAPLTMPLRWSYTENSFATQTLTAPNNTAIPNSTFVLIPGNQESATPSFTVKPATPTTYTIQQRGTYSLQGTPVIYTLTAETSSVTPGDQFTLTAESTTATSTNTTGIFEVTEPDTYSISAPTFTNAGGEVLYTVTIAPGTYSLEPGGITSTVNLFTVSPLTSTTYTIYGISSSTLGTDTETTQATTVANTTMTAGSQSAPFSVTNPIFQVPTLFSARLAVAANNSALTGNQNAVLVSRNPLSLNDPVSFVRVSQSGAKKDDQNGDPSNDIQVVNGRATVLEWSKSGTELYYATDANELYRVSHITDIFDLTNASYAGKFFTDVFQYNPSTTNNAALNPNSPYRTTLIGKFDKPITSIRVKFDDTRVLVTLNGAATGTSGTVYYTTNADIRKCGTNVTWEEKSSAPLKGIPTYCSLMEMDNNNKVFVGTDRGLFYTNNIDATPATWVNVNTLADPEGYLPRVRIYDIEQQTRDHFDAFNSREIYVATYGRGVWSNSFYHVPYVTEVEEQENITRFENNLSLFPNPTNGVVNVSFDAMDNEAVTVYVMDINGRAVKTENLGRLAPGETTFKIDTSEMSSSVYIVNISGTSALKRVAKLIVTK